MRSTDNGRKSEKSDGKVPVDARNQKESDKNRRPSVCGLPHRIVVEIMLHGVSEDWGPPGYGVPTDVTMVLERAGLIEIGTLDGEPMHFWHARTTPRGREWIARYGVE